MKRMRNKAFTLVEILIVVIILGILAAVALPKFSNASAAAKASMLADNLRIMRTQLAVFQGQHNGVAPGYPGCDTTKTPTEADFVAHMTKSSTAFGDTAQPGTAGYHYGPYFREMAVNPVNSKASVKIIGDGQEVPSTPDDNYGWFYQPSTLIFKASSSGNDEEGRAYINY